MGSAGKGMSHLDYSTNPSLSPPIQFPERPCESQNCEGSLTLNFNRGFLSCGGLTSVQCHHLTFGESAWEPFPPMRRHHLYGTGLTLWNGDVWMTGGDSKTEMFKNGVWVDGPDLPASCTSHNMIQVSEDEVML